MRPRIVRSPVDICFGTKPSQAAKSRPLAKAVPLPMAATMALAMSGPMPGAVINWRQLSLPCARTSISSVMCLIRSSRRRQSLLRSSMILIMRGDNTFAAFCQDVRKLLAEEAKPLTYRNAVLQEKAADLIDHSRPLADQARSHPVQCLEIELIVGLHWNAAGGRPLDSLRDRVGVSGVVLVALPERV